MTRAGDQPAPLHPGRRRRRTAWLGVAALLLVLGAAVVVNQSAVHWRSNVVDDLLFAYHGWCVSRGATPYVDIWDNKPPGIWWLNALAFKLCGDGVAPELWLSGTALLASLLALNAVARNAYRPSLLWPAALVGVALLTDQRYECGGNRTETYVVTFETLAVLGYVLWLRRRHGRWLLFAGLCGGAAPLFKQSGIAAGAAILIHLAWVTIAERRANAVARAVGPPLASRFLGASRAAPRFALLLCGLAIAPAVAGGVLVAQGAFGEAWFAVVTFNRAYFAINDATWIHMDRAWGALEQAFRPLVPLVTLAATGLALAWCTRFVQNARRRAVPARPRRGVGVFVLWWLISTYLTAVGPGRREYHLAPSLAPLGLILLFTVHQLAGSRRLADALSHSATRAAALVVWAYVVVAFMPPSWAEVDRIWKQKPAWWALRRSVPASFEAQAAVVASRSSPDDRIYVSGWSPGTYRFAYRLPATRYATSEKVGQVGRWARFIDEGATQDLLARPPKVYVISESDYAGLMGDTDAPLRRLLCECYRHDSDVQGMRVFVRRDDAPSPAAFGQPQTAPLASRPAPDAPP